MLSNMDIEKKFKNYIPKVQEEDPRMRAAVLIPIVTIDGTEHILFQVRSSKLRWQPGDISFPGGKWEPEDRSLKDTALRECTEELGITLSDIQYIGAIDKVVSPIGVQLYPKVGRLLTKIWHPNPDEVEELFTVPLKILAEMEPKKAIMKSATKPDSDFPYDLLPQYNKEWRVRHTYEVYFFPYKQYVIWGLTALVLKNFLDIYRK